MKIPRGYGDYMTPLILFTALLLAPITPQAPQPMPLPITKIIPISQFGAKGDGKTDDTKSFLAAISAAASAGARARAGKQHVSSNGNAQDTEDHKTHFNCWRRRDETCVCAAVSSGHWDSNLKRLGSRAEIVHYPWVECRPQSRHFSHGLYGHPTGSPSD